MSDPTLDESWRARARDRFRRLTARELAELLMKTPDAVVLVDTAIPETSGHPAGDKQAAVT